MAAVEENAVVAPLEGHVQCSKYSCAFPLHVLVQEGKHTNLCNLCHRLHTLLTRHLGGAFLSKLQGATPAEKHAFLSDLCKKHEADGNLSYQRVRDTVTARTVSRTVTEHSNTLGGEFLPLSVYKTGATRQSMSRTSKGTAKPSVTKDGIDKQAEELPEEPDNCVDLLSDEDVKEELVQ
ncbi:unnamed protein product, partial [Symbiodinium sp. CCMP2456]